MEEYITTLLRKLEYDFRKLREDLEKLQYAIDYSSLTKKGNLDQLKAKLGTEELQVQGDLILLSKEQFNKARPLLSEFFYSDRTTPETIKGATRDSILRESAEARAKFSKKVNKKVGSLLKYASPSFKVEFSDAIYKKISRYKLSFAVDDEVSKFLNRFADIVLDQVYSSIITERNNTIQKAIDSRVEAIVEAFRTGKGIKYSNTVKDSKSSKPKVKGPKYYTPIQDTKGIFTSVLKLKNIINVLLHNTIKKSFMKPASYPVNDNYLRYQTGRFAYSARVTDIVRKDPVSLLVKYTYMEYPYAVFENSGTNRDPRRIISASIQEILASQVHGKFSILTRKG